MKLASYQLLYPAILKNHPNNDGKGLEWVSDVFNIYQVEFNHIKCWLKLTYNQASQPTFLTDFVQDTPFPKKILVLELTVSKSSCF